MATSNLCKVTTPHVLLYSRETHINLVSNSLVHAVLLTVSICSPKAALSLTFGLASRCSCLAMMVLSLCGNPNYRSSFVERNTLVIVIVLIKVSGTPPNLGRLMLPHGVPSPCSNCYIIMAKERIFQCK